MIEFIMEHRESLIVLALLVIVAIPVNIIAYCRNRQGRKAIQEYWQHHIKNLRDLQDGE